MLLSLRSFFVNRLYSSILCKPNKSPTLSSKQCENVLFSCFKYGPWNKMSQQQCFAPRQQPANVKIIISMSRFVLLNVYPEGGSMLSSSSKSMMSGKLLDLQVSGFPSPSGGEYSILCAHMQQASSRSIVFGSTSTFFFIGINSLLQKTKLIIQFYKNLLLFQFYQVSIQQAIHML